MLTFLFWNLGKKRLTDSVVRLAAAHQVDVLMLAESALPQEELLEALTKAGLPDYRYVPGIVHARVHVFIRGSVKSMIPIHEDGQVTIWDLHAGDKASLLVVGAHLASKLYQSVDSQTLECAALAAKIREAEEEMGHRRTVLIGDLNMHPFDPGMIGANGLHAVSSRRVAAKNSRTVNGRAYRFFYNPMWGHMGDIAGTPAGSYYYVRAEHVNYFWNMFDQVLLRPELLGAFRDEDLRILTTDGVDSIVSRTGTPNKKSASDHLPILLRLNL